MRYLLIGTLLLLGSPAKATPQECLPSDSCVSEADMQVFLTVLGEKECLQINKPTFTLPPIQVTQDSAGRIYVGGGQTPRLHMDWCNYRVDADLKLNVQVAQAVEPEWGFRYRIKVAPGYLPLEALSQKDGYAGLDVGLMAEPFFYHEFNLNGYVGARSLGLGVGMDLTRNFGLYAGYVVTFMNWQVTPHVALTFSLW